jgi:hypothetical protein
MRPVQRFLLRTSELVIALIGLRVSFHLGMLFDRIEYPLTPLTFCLGCVLTVVALVIYRRKTRPWKIHYDARSWELYQSEQRLHPRRARSRKIARRVLIWAPSAVAALVLFFFPVVTHLLHPGVHLVGRYRIPTAWTFAVFPSPEAPEGGNGVDVVVGRTGRSRYGMTPFEVLPFWMTREPVSVVNFGSSPDAGPCRNLAGERVSQIREFRLGDIAFTCWQYRPEYRSHYWPGSMVAWIVECETPAAAGPRQFSARFYGREQDLGSFYQIVERITPIQ